MRKKIAAACALALVGVWVALVLLGKKMLPAAPLHQACIVPFGAKAWEQVMLNLVEIGSTKEDIVRKLGVPNDTARSNGDPGFNLLIYTNPHDGSRAVAYAISRENVLIFASPAMSSPRGAVLDEGAIGFP